MTNIYYPSYTNISYHPTGSGHEYQVLNIFYPTGPMPAGGWPVLIHTNVTGFGEGPPFPFISSDTTNKRQALAYFALQAGFAVVSVGLTGAGTNSSARLGGGLFHPPGSPVGRYEDDSYPMCIKDATWSIQFVRHYAATYNLNANKITTCGYSSGSISYAWPSLGPDRADPTKTDFRVASSRPNAVILHNHQSWFEAFSSGNVNVLANVYPDTGYFLTSGHYATSFSKAPYPPGYLNYPKELSDLYYGFLDSTTGLNARLPVYINSEYAGVYPIADNTFDGSGFPVLRDSLTNIHDPWWSSMLRARLLSLDYDFHYANSKYNQVTGGTFTGGYGETSTITYTGTIDEVLMSDIVSWMSGMFYVASDPRPEYWRDLYGDATIAWVPPVTNYLYDDNLSKRGINDRSFRWQEVSIELDSVPEGAILDFISPDYYMIQITPDLHWHDQLAMFGESKDPDIFNPHLINLGPFSISNGTLTHNIDNSASVELSEEQMNNAIIDGYDKYLWRAVPWAEGNPGIGGFPSVFEWISSRDQIKFTVDPIKKDPTKSTQIISGTKDIRVTITVEAENSPTIFVEQTSTAWKVIFAIDRENIKFNIIATDEGGSATITYPIDLTFKLNTQINSHVWNAFDGFALLASLERLPNESNAKLKDRIIDAFSNKGGTHYTGLLNGINRDLGLKRKDEALIIKRYKNPTRSPESSLFVETTHTRLSVHASSFVIYDEIQKIDSYNNTVTLNKRAMEIISIATANGQEIPQSDFYIKTGDGITTGNIVSITGHRGLVKITYAYKENLLYTDYPKIIQLIHALNSLQSPNGNRIIEATIDPKMSGSELSKYLYRLNSIVNSTNTQAVIGWSSIGLFSISDLEYKWSFANYNSAFFDSEFYNFVAELKSKTNIEWGFVVADRDYWDAIDSENYGYDSLPIACDIPLAKYVTVIPISNKPTTFDSMQAHRMGYYFDNVLIKNHGFPQTVFKSGVGYKRDCSVASVNKIFTSDNTNLNLNIPTVLPSAFPSVTGSIVDI